MRTSVFSVAGLVSSGSRWRKSVRGGSAVFQTGSSSVPSKCGAWSVREPFASLEPRVCGGFWEHNIEFAAIIVSSSGKTRRSRNRTEFMRRLDDIPRVLALSRDWGFSEDSLTTSCDSQSARDSCRKAAIISSFPSVSTRNHCPPQLLHNKALIFRCARIGIRAQCS